MLRKTAFVGRHIGSLFCRFQPHDALEYERRAFRKPRPERPFDPALLIIRTFDRENLFFHGKRCRIYGDIIILVEKIFNGRGIFACVK